MDIFNARSNSTLGDLEQYFYLHFGSLTTENGIATQPPVGGTHSSFHSGTQQAADWMGSQAVIAGRYGLFPCSSAVDDAVYDPDAVCWEALSLADYAGTGFETTRAGLGPL